MNRVVILMALVLSTVVGCGGPAAPSMLAPPFEVSWDVVGEGGDINGVGSSCFIRIGDNTLEINQKQVSVNDKPCGALKNGDKVKLDQDGSLFVNGEKRTCD